MSVAIKWDESVKDIEKATGSALGFTYRKDLPAGSAAWFKNAAGNVTSLHFICPCGCGMTGAVPIQPERADGWALSGTLERPYLEPSIQMLGPCRWHGYLRNGVFEGC